MVTINWTFLNKDFGSEKGLIPKLCYVKERFMSARKTVHRKMCRSKIVQKKGSKFETEKYLGNLNRFFELFQK